MIRYYSNRRLAAAFEVNLAKWKRWSRAFLPPDPLGGYQSGYARQYSLNESLRVFLGGHLVAGLKFTLPEAAQILGDIEQWLEGHQFYFNTRPKAGSGGYLEEGVRTYRIEIIRQIADGPPAVLFAYRICGTISTDRTVYGDTSLVSERFVEIWLHRPDEVHRSESSGGVRLLEISRLHRIFCNKLGV